MKNQKRILGIIWVVLWCAVGGHGQDCFELNGSQTLLSGPYKGRSFELSTRRFKTSADCAAAAAKYKSGSAVDGWRYSVNCKQCEGYSKDNTAANDGNKIVSQPKTTEKPTVSPPSIGMVKKKEIDLNSLCPSQRQNIEKLQSKQNALDKNDVAMNSFINSAINNMVNVECGVVLKDLNCVGKHCEFEWAPQKSSTNDTKGQASVQQFKDAVVKDLRAAEAEVAKQNAEMEKKNAKQAENVALAQMVVDAATVIADAIFDEDGPSKQSKAKPVDDDGDGKTDALVEDLPDGGQNIYMDTDGDGVADKVAHIDNIGQVKYETLDQFSSPIKMTPDGTNEHGTSINQHGGEIEKSTPSGKFLYLEADRIKSIKNDEGNGYINISDADNFTKPNIDPWFSNDLLEEVTSNNASIEKVAKEFDMDPDIIRALIWVESTHGWYDRGNPQPSTIRPMNVDPKLWSGIVPEISKIYFDKEYNIRTGALIYKRIENRLVNPTIERTASLYNNTATDNVTAYGLAVSVYYATKPWLKK